MRTTLNTTYSNIQNNLNRLTTGMDKINERISSGRQMTTISDDPVNLVSALRYRTTIAELAQFGSNITHGNSVINASESALTQMKDLALQAKTLAIKASDSALSQDNLTAIAQQVQQMFQQAVELGNTQINGQFIFGGRRTTGYTAAEPAPFIIDKGDGHWINGATMPPLTNEITGSVIATAASLQGPPAANIAAGDLLINGDDIGAVDLTTAADVSGINMAGANNLKTAINAKTTVYADKAATAATADSAFTFALNNTAINVSVTAGLSATAVANAAITAINAQTAATGVTAVLGNGSNGGPVDAVVFKNSAPGDNSTISVSNFTTTLAGGAKLGFGDFSKKIVTAALTTQTAGVAATSAVGGEAVAFSLNGTNVSYTLTAGTIAQTVQQTITAINQVSKTTGVTAQLGTGSNGGVVNSVVLTNTLAGDESAIALANLDTGPPDETALTGLTNGTSNAGAGSNNGRIYLGMAAALDITTAGATAATPNDDILNRIGFGGGGRGNYDAAGDGRLVYGYPLASGDLRINGINVPATTPDGYSDIYAAASAAAKAAAINAITAQTGVTANITAAHVAANDVVNAGADPKYMSSGDLTINGINIFAVPTAISSKDSTNALLDAINAQTAGTGVKGTRDANGDLQLTAVDGRNIHIQTSANGENISKLNGTAGGSDRVYFGDLQLKSDRQFILNTVAKSVNALEPGLAAIGMAGGSTVTGEAGDAAGDGRIDVFSIHDQTGTVRYAGDRDNGLNIKIGKTSTMQVGDNGQTGVADTTIFTTLKDFEDALRAKNFTSVTGIHNAADTSQLLNSKATGLEPDSQLPSENLFTDGSFTVTVTDHDYYPPRTTAVPIGVNTAVDTLASVTSRIAGLPHISASWNSAGQLEIKSDEPQRYSISLGNDSSNFLAATGVSPQFMQRQGISKAMDNLDALMGKITEQVSTFGARANRIEIQKQIYSDMTVSTKGNLSEVQDTDMIKAVMDLKAKQTAYQAALAAAAKIMKLSLVDYL